MPAANSPAVRVLVVEDREDDFDFLRHVFDRTRQPIYELEWAPTYEAGRAAVARRCHDIALFDYTLGGSTGIDLIEEAQAAGCSMPIILLTGHDSPEIDEAASRAGAVDFLCKAALDPIMLERALRYALRQAEMRAVLRRSQQQLELFMRTVPCAVAIRDEAGDVLFENEVFRRHFNTPADRRRFSRQPFAGDGSGPTPFSSGGRHWLVNSFDMPGTEARRMTGFAALDVTERVEAESERRKATALLDSVMQNVPVIVGRLDDRGRVTEARGMGLAAAGFQPEAMLGEELSSMHPGAREAVREALAGGSSSCTLSGRGRDAEWHIELFLLPDGAPGGGATFFGRDVTERRWLERRLLTLTDAEQQRIGADLHDGLGQQLTGLSCLAAALRDRLRTMAPDQAAQADLISRLANDSVAQSRALARGLCPVQLANAGLVIALEELAAQSRTLHGIDCTFRVSGRHPQCDHLAAMHVYRIAQEAIHNAVRHGRAKSVEITLTSRRGQHRLLIVDDGSGFDSTLQRRAAGAGLRLMSYRAAMVGGALALESRPGAGTRISCHFSSYSNTHESSDARKEPDAQDCRVAC